MEKIGCSNQVSPLEDDADDDIMTCIVVSSHITVISTIIYITFHPSLLYLHFYYEYFGSGPYSVFNLKKMWSLYSCSPLPR